MSNGNNERLDGNDLLVGGEVAPVFAKAVLAANLHFRPGCLKPFSNSNLLPSSSLLLGIFLALFRPL